jgi:hypothetical protein
VGRRALAGETTRAFEAGPEGVELIVFGASRRALGDVEMTPNWWTE